MQFYPKRDVPRRRRARRHSQQARGSESGHRIVGWRAFTLKKPTCHRITDSRVADVKESHITTPEARPHSPATAENIYSQLIGECAEGQ
jgi:hypothetical protein